ncbi:RING finger protein 10-like isoform X2 [Penaeus japonicus]|uniref:RING finger protein 10-like isoform X2 n=1 Tax=Penaeus japonicus TaxID=27405 RepID=UPI001C70D9EB|nr:RING finger protein 10-like isoform X2 [Penaeus japonicus]
MDTQPAMDKKAMAKAPPLPAKNGSEGTLKDYGGKKSAPQYARKRDFDRPDPGKKPVAGRGGRAGQRYVRPREKTGGQVESSNSNVESGSLYRMGGKKQNITHLMNWWGPSHRSQTGHGHHQRGGARVRRYSSHTPKYSKEHYLQANCQFVVKEGEDYSVYSADPDLLVEWKLVEEVRLHAFEAPACPICLHPPTAAKVTRCGHIYCYPCILHYLALSDDKWRNCPICYVPVEKDELRSVKAVCHKDFSVGEEIELRLMRRERESLLPMPSASFSLKVLNEMQRVGSPNAATPFAKLIVASKEEVYKHIVEREERDLVAQLVEEGDQPEACFIDEALSLLHKRREALMLSDTKDGKSLKKTVEGMHSLSLSSPEEELCAAKRLSSENLAEEPICPTFPVEQEPFSLPKPSPPTDTKVADFKLGTETTVTADDLDISQLQPGNTTGPAHGQMQKNVPKSTYYFYQASNGAHIYLHTLNVQMLVHEYGDLVNCPAVFKARVVDKESVLMTDELRQRIRYLSHLPVACSFDVVEVMLKHPLVSKLTTATYQEKIDARQHIRNKRAREERKIERRVQAEQDRMMGRSRGATNLRVNSFLHFPSFAEDFPANPGLEATDGSVTIPGGPEGSEYSTSPTGDSLYGSSTDTSGSGISFAKMIREGQSKVHPLPSESANPAGGLWPSLGKAAWPDPLNAVKNKTEGGSTWGTKSGASHSGAGAPSANSEILSEDEEEEGAPVPEFKHAFSDAIARAFDSAVLKPSGQNKELEVSTAGGKKGKKKKKKVLLFSSGGFN